MTHFSDGLTIGNPRGYGSGRALPASLTSYAITPATLDRDGFCAAQQLGAAGDLLLNGALVVGGVGKFDVPRAVGIYSAADLSGVTFNVYGYDTYGQPTREQFTGPNAGTRAGKKAFASVVRVAASAAVGSNVEVGTIDVFGLPVRVPAAPMVAWVGWNALSRDTGTLAVSVDTSPATATTGDVRGTYTPSSAADGSKLLALVLIPIRGARHVQYGVTQYGQGVQIKMAKRKTTGHDGKVTAPVDDAPEGATTANAPAPAEEPGDPPAGPFAMNDPNEQVKLVNDGVPQNAPNEAEGKAQAAEARAELGAANAEAENVAAHSREDVFAEAEGSGGAPQAPVEPEGEAHEPEPAEEETEEDAPGAPEVSKPTGDTGDTKIVGAPKGRFVVEMKASVLEERGGPDKVAEEEGWTLHGATVDHANDLAKLEVEGGE